MKNSSSVRFFIALILGMSLAACHKDDYHDFTKGGELIYSSRMDTAIVVPGKNRLQLTLIKKSDPLMDKILIYWNDKSDSMELKAGDPTKDTLSIYISPLEEGNYNFEIFTFDKEGHSSVVFNAAGDVYGDGYANSLTKRAITSSEQTSDGGSLLLNWGHSSVGEIGTLIHYLNKNNDSVTLNVMPLQSSILVPDYKENTSFTYQSIYKPENNFIDTFYTPEDTVAFPPLETMVAKSLLKIYPLPTDIKEGSYGWLMQYLWDDNFGTPGMATQDGVPQWFTIDLSSEISLTHLKIWQASDRLYAQQNVKKFEVWGSNAPNPDGSWASWNQIMTCESYKPSGQPVGENTQEDIDYATNGESFQFPAGTPKYRYLRFKLLENWENKPFMTIGELAFWQLK